MASSEVSTQRESCTSSCCPMTTTRIMSTVRAHWRAKSLASHACACCLGVFLRADTCVMCWGIVCRMLPYVRIRQRPLLGETEASMCWYQDTNFHRKARGGPTATVDTLRKDAENQKAIMAGRGGKRRKGPAQAEAQSMTPHLEMHAARGEEAGRGRRAAKERNQKGKRQFQKTVYGKQALPPDEATPFFTTYVLHYAFPTIAIVCTCLGCILLRTMKMYQKERWKGTSYFHGEACFACVCLPVTACLRASRSDRSSFLGPSCGSVVKSCGCAQVLAALPSPCCLVSSREETHGVRGKEGREGGASSHITCICCKSRCPECMCCRGCS